MPGYMAVPSVPYLRTYKLLACTQRANTPTAGFLRMRPNRVCGSEASLPDNKAIFITF